MQQRAVTQSKRFDLTSFVLAIAAFAMLAFACVAINWLLYSDYASRRAARDAQETEFRAKCADLLMKRRSEPGNQQVAAELVKCVTARSRLSR